MHEDDRTEQNKKTKKQGWNRLANDTVDAVKELVKSGEGAAILS